MNQPMPLMPQGPSHDGRNKTKILITVCVIVALHVVPISGLLLVQGCSQSEIHTVDARTSDSLPAAEPAVPSETILPPPGEEPQEPQAGEIQLGGAGAPEPVQPEPPAEPPIDVIPGEETLSAESYLAQEEDFTIPHVVRPGDRFYDLAKTFGVQVADILEANPDVDSRRLQVGQEILIPKKNYRARLSEEGPTLEGEVALRTGTPARHRTYVIQRGDTLSGIAFAHGVTVRMLREANGLSSDAIQAGKSLRIPEPITAEVVALPGN